MGDYPPQYYSPRARKYYRKRPSVAGGGGAGVSSVGGWKELGRTTLGSAGNNIDVSSLPDKRYYMILGSAFPSGNTYGGLRFNSDSGTNYSSRRSENGGADGTTTSDSKIFFNRGVSVYPANMLFSVGYVANYSSKEKLSIIHGVTDGGSSAGNDPERLQCVGKWTNTSNAISSINNVQLDSGSWNTGSELIVLGYDPADTHTTTDNFWEEIYSTTLESDSSTSNAQFDTGAFTGKKYLWIQIFADANFDPLIRFNSDTGNNYASRTSYNGATDSTNINTSHTNTGATFVASNIGFGNIFIVNVANKEKLGICNGVRVDTLGAGTSPNFKGENVFKWTNTSNQITSMQIEKGSGTLRAGTTIKIWGAD